MEEFDVHPGVADASRKPAILERLSEREREIARLIAQGHSNRAIAELLVLSIKTVETHVKHIFTKLNKMGIIPSPLSSDAEFCRRVHLDIAGILPTANAVRIQIWTALIAVLAQSG